MNRPDFVTGQDIERWSGIIDTESTHIQGFASLLPLREVLYASFWLAEQLQQEKCPTDIITRIQYTMGSLSFGKDPWAVAQEMLQAYQNNEMEFEMDYNEES